MHIALVRGGQDEVSMLSDESNQPQSLFAGSFLMNWPPNARVEELIHPDGIDNFQM